MAGAYDVEREPWVAYQTNGYAVTFTLQRRDVFLLTGTARYNGAEGQVSGRVQGDRIVMTVSWNPDSVGEYNGSFGVDGRLSGHCFDQRHPESQATWYTPTPFTAVGY
ncbi:hypothetical protein HS041_32590 [Planomonospora sp. ID67723]|uniref:hypothetical protein n=1 Tax=Planomonospora sp. ID67723 TaxID=2738134 RepID=UPI0018C3ECF1|nr:hypothetical protein [Planomonospora sp. ID67723]MBG0832446.1 hypothetical protein [Planomonospora sp. ID67723]